jgi:thymidine kinase
VICYGIRSDFLGEPFPGAAYLLTLADSLEEVKNVCNCGKKATMNPRVDDQGKRVTIGTQIAIEGEVRYVPMCGSCFYSMMA